jgi:hypothetical protein
VDVTIKAGLPIMQEPGFCMGHFNLDGFDPVVANESIGDYRRGLIYISTSKALYMSLPYGLQNEFFKGCVAVMPITLLSGYLFFSLTNGNMPINQGFKGESFPSAGQACQGTHVQLPMLEFRL